MSTKKEKCCENCLSYPKGATPCLLGIEHKGRKDVDVTEPTERLVIEYANLSGRESANRAEFRKRAEVILSKAITTAVAKRELEIAEEVNKILPKDWAEKAEKAKKEGDYELRVEKILSIINKH